MSCKIFEHVLYWAVYTDIMQLPEISHNQKGMSSSHSSGMLLGAVSLSDIQILLIGLLHNRRIKDKLARTHTTIKYTTAASLVYCT